MHCDQLCTWSVAPEKGGGGVILADLVGDLPGGDSFTAAKEWFVSGGVPQSLPPGVSMARAVAGCPASDLGDVSLQRQEQVLSQCKHVGLRVLCPPHPTPHCPLGTDCFCSPLRAPSDVTGTTSYIRRLAGTVTCTSPEADRTGMCHCLSATSPFLCPQVACPGTVGPERLVQQ